MPAAWSWLSRAAANSRGGGRRSGGILRKKAACAIPIPGRRLRRDEGRGHRRRACIASMDSPSSSGGRAITPTRRTLIAWRLELDEPGGGEFARRRAALRGHFAQKGGLRDTYTRTPLAEG